MQRAREDRRGGGRLHSEDQRPLIVSVQVWMLFNCNERVDVKSIYNGYFSVYLVITRDVFSFIVLT